MLLIHSSLSLNGGEHNMLTRRQYIVTVCLALALFVILMLTFDTAFVKELDYDVLHTIFEWRTSWLTPFFIFITTLGSWYVTAPIWLVLVILLMYKRQGISALFITLVFWGVRGLNWLLKEIFERPRPGWSQLIDASHYSFPSGHAMNSSAFFVGLLCLVLAYSKTQSVRSIAYTSFILLIILVGFSRMYLGVHYLTDVLAGYALGISWAISMYQLYRKFMQSSLKKYQFPT